MAASSRAGLAVLAVAVPLGLFGAVFTGGASPAGDPSPSDPPTGPMSVIVGVDPEQLTCLAGGAAGGEMLRADDIAARLADGQSYRLFDLTGEAGEAISIGGPRFEGGEGECIDLWRQELSLDPRKSGSFMVALKLPGAGTDPLPSPLEVLDEPLPEHTALIGDFLARRGVPDPEPGIVQAIRTDLEGDGTPEVILNSIRVSPENARKGDHSIILVQRGEGEAARTFIIQEEIDVEDSEYPSTLWTNTITAVVDVDGDGVAEIITEGGYLYGGGWEVIRWDGNAFEHALFCGCAG